MRFHLRSLLASLTLCAGLSGVAMAQDDTGDTAEPIEPTVQLADAKTDDGGCAVVTAPAAATLAAMGLLIAARRRA